MIKDELLNNVYIAKAYAIKNIKNNKIKDISSPLDVFLVKPIIKRNFFGEEFILGFNELITGDEIIYRKNYKDSFITNDYDIISKDSYNNGDIYWEVITRVLAKNIVDDEYLNNYLLKSSDDIKYELLTVRNYAKKIFDNYNKIHLKKK